jgi:hypothetical protein
MVLSKFIRVSSPATSWTERGAMEQLNELIVAAKQAQEKARLQTCPLPQFNVEFGY